jgi:thioredoxin 1
MAEIRVLDEDNFNVFIATGAVAVDFYADWCGPCKQMAPTFDQAAEDYDGKIKFGKLNVDLAKSIAMTYKVMSIPTLLFFKDGEPVNRSMGVQDQSALNAKLDSLL